MVQFMMARCICSLFFFFFFFYFPFRLKNEKQHAVDVKQKKHR